MKHLFTIGFLGCAVMSQACSSPAETTTQPVDLNSTVWVDSTFDATEMQGIKAGINTWYSTLSQVDFTIQIVDHATVMAGQRNPQAGNIYVLKVVSVTDPDCGFSMNPAFAAETVILEDRTADICFNTAQACDNLTEWTIGIQHELGHAMGLVHTPQDIPAIMRPQIVLDGVVAPNCTDLEQLADVRGISLGQCGR